MCIYSDIAGYHLLTCSVYSQIKHITLLLFSQQYYVCTKQNSTSSNLFVGCRNVCLFIGESTNTDTFWLYHKQRIRWPREICNLKNQRLMACYYSIRPYIVVVICFFCHEHLIQIKHASVTEIFTDSLANMIIGQWALQNVTTMTVCNKTGIYVY